MAICPHRRATVVAQRGISAGDTAPAYHWRRFVPHPKTTVVAQRGIPANHSALAYH